VNRFGTFCKKDVKTNRKEVNSLYREYDNSIIMLFRSFFLRQKDFEYMETDDKIVIKTPTKQVIWKTKKRVGLTTRL
jgi:hypothetical protein